MSDNEPSNEALERAWRFITIRRQIGPQQWYVVVGEDLFEYQETIKEPFNTEQNARDAAIALVYALARSFDEFAAARGIE